MADQAESSRGVDGGDTDPPPSAQARLAEAALSFLRGPLPTLSAPEG
eukprot:COSAG01_NODE_45799_length_405_cov_0.723127_1_plen_46_part_10